MTYFIGIEGPPRLAADAVEGIVIARLDLDPSSMQCVIPHYMVTIPYQYNAKPRCVSLQSRRRLFTLPCSYSEQSDGVRISDWLLEKTEHLEICSAEKGVWILHLLESFTYVLFLQGYPPADLKQALALEESMRHLIISYIGIDLMSPEAFPHPPGYVFAIVQILSPMLTFTSHTAKSSVLPNLLPCSSPFRPSPLLRTLPRDLLAHLSRPLKSKAFSLTSLLASTPTANLSPSLVPSS